MKIKYVVVPLNDSLIDPDPASVPPCPAYRYDNKEQALKIGKSYANSYKVSIAIFILVINDMTICGRSINEIISSDIAHTFFVCNWN
ncbi:MAG TPA: hypothetical protein VJN02_07915 [Gammaproteobacteria bacterium]|nr:hypothetical protein [Gammaproteobacteria bacterium]